MKLVTSSRYRLISIGLKLAICAAVLVLATLFGYRASSRWLILPVMGLGAIVLLGRPVLGLLVLVPTTLLLAMEFGTGTAVAVNPVTLLVPALLALWVLDMVRQRDLHLVPSRTNRPLSLFLLAGLLSLLVGNVLWDPTVPRAGNFTIVQLAQWAIFAFSAGAFWLTGNLVRDEAWLRRLTFLFLAVAGSLATLCVLPGGQRLVSRGVVTLAVHRAPFWLLLTALAGGQLLLGGVLVWAFFLMRRAVSHWTGVTAAAGVLASLRWPRLRWPVVVLFLMLAVTGVLFSTVYDFAGGAAEWEESGGSRLALMGRVIELTMRNPITGLGPAAYRQYGETGSLSYGGAYYASIWLSSHNNYVDLFSHVGLLGLGLFFWFGVELTRLGLRLRARFTEGFASGYVNGMLAAWAGSLVLMLLADWILPFVYNIGFPGFQASVLVWLFLGGLVALEQIANGKSQIANGE